jgi:hypothetical protein
VRIGLSLILLAAGAILTWAVTATVSGVDIRVVGVILMIVGAIGLVLSVFFASSLGGGASVRRRDVVTDSAGGQTVRDSYTTRV